MQGKFTKKQFLHNVCDMADFGGFSVDDILKEIWKVYGEYLHTMLDWALNKCRERYPKLKFDSDAEGIHCMSEISDPLHTEVSEYYKQVPDENSFDKFILSIKGDSFYRKYKRS